MNYKFKVGDLALLVPKVGLTADGRTPALTFPGEIGLITARRSHASAASAEHTLAEYTILIGGIPWMVFEYELTKVNK